MSCHSTSHYYYEVTGNGKYSIADLRDFRKYYEGRFKNAEKALKDAKAKGADKILPKRVIKNADDWYAKIKKHYDNLISYCNKAQAKFDRIQVIYQSALGHNDTGGDCNTDYHRGEARDAVSSFNYYFKNIDRKKIQGEDARHFYGNIQKLEGKANWLNKIVHWVNRVSMNILIPMIGMFLKTNVLGLATKLDITRRKYPLNWNKVRSRFYTGFGVEYSELNNWISIGKNKQAITKPTQVKQAFKNLKGTKAFSGFAGSETAHKYKVLYNGYFNAEGETTTDTNPDSPLTPDQQKAVADAAATKATQLGNAAKASDNNGKNSNWKPAAYALIPTVTAAAGTAVGVPWGNVGGAAVGGLLDLVVAALPDKFSKEDTKGTPVDPDNPNSPDNPNNQPSKTSIFIKNIPLWVKVTVPATVVVGSVLVIFRKKIF